MSAVIPISDQRVVRSRWGQGIWPIFLKVLVVECEDWPREVLAVAAIPISFFLAFGLGLSQHIQELDGVPYTQFITPGLIALTTVLTAYRTTGWELWLARWHNRLMYELLVKPVPRTEIIVGEMLGAIVMALMKGSIVAVVLYLFKPYPLVWQNLLMWLALLIPACGIFACVGCIVGTLFRKPDHIAQMDSIIITPLLYLGGLFFPLSTFPVWAQGWMKWLPTTALFDGGRQAFLFGQLSWGYVALLWGLAALSVVVSTVVFNKRAHMGA